MLIYFQYFVLDLEVVSCLLIFLMSSIGMTDATSILSSLNSDVDQQMRRATECNSIDQEKTVNSSSFSFIDVMTSSTIDGIKRSNVCGDGYRIDGALLKSYPYSKSQSYFPHEDCYMTFQVDEIDSNGIDSVFSCARLVDRIIKFVFDFYLLI